MKKIFFLAVLLSAFSAAATAQQLTATATISDAHLTRPRKVNNPYIVSTAASRISAPDLEREAFKLLNEKRAAEHLAPLAWDEEVAKVARVHSQNMANHKFFSHRGLDGSMVNDRADKVGLSKWRLIGENIAYMRGYSDPAAFAVECWMNSAAHKQNLLGKDWKQSAVGVAVADDGSLYFTQVFMVRK